MENAPNFAYAYTRLGLALLGQSRFEEAISSIKKAKDISSDRASTTADLILANWLAGRKEEAEKELDRLEKRSEHEYVSNVSLALANAAVDRKKRAIDLLEKAVAEKSNQLRSNVREQPFDKLRSDPRFQNILRTIGIE